MSGLHGRAGEVRRNEKARGLTRASFRKGGADGRTRTVTSCDTRPSNVRVYQFHHIRTWVLWTDCLATSPVQKRQRDAAWNVPESHVEPDEPPPLEPPPELPLPLEPELP